MSIATEPILGAFDFAVVPERHSVRSSVLADYWTLTKPEVNFLIDVAMGVSFRVGYPKTLAQFPWMMLLHTVLGTVLVASGAGTLNQLIEWHFDARMRRIARRPVVAGRISRPFNDSVFLESRRDRQFQLLLSVILSGALPKSEAARAEEVPPTTVKQASDTSSPQRMSSAS